MPMVFFVCFVMCGKECRSVGDFQVVGKSGFARWLVGAPALSDGLSETTYRCLV
jgi:hypothetical protein